MVSHMELERQVGQSVSVMCFCRWILRLPLRPCSVISSLDSAAYAADMRANARKELVQVDSITKLK